MTDNASASLAMVTIDCDDVKAESAFWKELIGGETTEHGEDYVMLKTESTTLGFGRVDGYARPSWPDDGHKQFHLDLSVTDLEAAAAHAEELGATRAEPQPEGAEGKWIVLLDPAGHPFCVAIWG